MIHMTSVAQRTYDQLIPLFLRRDPLIRDLLFGSTALPRDPFNDFCLLHHVILPVHFTGRMPWLCDLQDGHCSRPELQTLSAIQTRQYFISRYTDSQT